MDGEVVMGAWVALVAKGNSSMFTLGFTCYFAYTLF